MAKKSQRLAKAPSTASEAASPAAQAARSQLLRKVGPDRIQVQFVIDDLVERLIKDRLGPVMGCNGCNACN